MGRGGRNAGAQTLSRPLRVLSISTLFPRPDKPGFGRFVERQFDALAARGDVDLTVINPLPGLPTLRRAKLDRSHPYPVYHLPVATIPRFGVRWNPALIAHAALPLVRKLHAEEPFDLIDAQFFYPDGPAAARIAAALGLPLSIKARGSDIHYWGQQGFAVRQMLSAAAQASGMLAVSGALRADMAALGMPADKIAAHYTGLDHTVFVPQDRHKARAEVAAWDSEAEITPVPAHGKLIVCTGNLIPLKGQALVIEALAELPDIRLLIAGNGPDWRILRQCAADLGLADRVHFGSYAPIDLALVLAAANAMVLPSASEGLANAWIEALACGTPLVITDVGGAREVVTSPTAGRLIERSPKAIAAAVRDILANPPAQAAVAAHAARFSWEVNAVQLAAHYRRVVGA